MIDTRFLTCAVATLAYLTLTGVAEAGTITALGNVTALDDISQIPSITGSAQFDEEFNGIIPADQYPGLTFHTGELGMILSGVLEAGEVLDPYYSSPGVFFPYPVAGGGVQLGSIIYNGGAVTFSDPVTQFGLVAGGSAETLHITAWDQEGMLIGQVSWEPEEIEAAFVGIDTMGVPIGLLTVGNDNLFEGAEYDDQGAAANSDNWIWGVAAPCRSDDECFNDGWSCTGHACDAGACSYALTTEPCDDGDACTEIDTCAEGLCVGTTVQCSDGNVCTFDSCDSDRGCSNAPIDGCCLSNEDCPDGGICLLGSNTCVGGPPPPPPGDGDGDPDPDEGGQDTETGDEAGPAAEGGGCGCTTQERGSGALLGLLGLALLGTTRRRRS